ncbi:hypothetical protein [Aeromonas enteropelogenes]|uniref:hypothetical protein n=1 Tax=Aeromonas enteropelogenes TaxID=29489 RepID=UPI003B9EBFFD
MLFLDGSVFFTKGNDCNVLVFKKKKGDNMSKVHIAAAIIGAMGFVGGVSAADEASQVFNWTGSVPATSTTGGAWIIKSPSGGEVDSGILAFTADETGKGVLTSSTDLAFNVFSYDSGTVGAQAEKYSYKLTNLAINSNGLAQEQGDKGYFEIRGNASALEKDTVVADVSGETVLTVAPTTEANPSNQPAAGDDVNVQATIVITSAAAV